MTGKDRQKLRGPATKGVFEFYFYCLWPSIVVGTAKTNFGGLDW